MTIFVRSIGRWLNTSVTFLESTFILWPTEAKKKDGSSSLTITMMLFFGLACVDAKLLKTKMKDWTYPSLAKNIKNERIINKLNYDIA